MVGGEADAMDGDERKWATASTLGAANGVEERCSRSEDGAVEGWCRWMKWRWVEQGEGGAAGGVMVAALKCGVRA
jgi:hypothetical protein